MDSWFSNINDGDRDYWYKKYDTFNYGLRNSDSLDFLSPFIVEGILERKIRLNKSSISISPCSFSDYSKCTAGDKREFLVSYAARIFPDKNPILYIEAAKIIIKKYPFVKFNLLGEGLSYLYQEIKKFIEINNLKDNLNFYFHPNPPEVFSKSTIFVSIQTTNNYPSQSVLEAMACGNAIIASDVGDTRMFVNDEVGILIPLNLISLVNALELLIKDKELAIKLGKNAREFVLKNHTIEKCSEYYLDLFEQTSEKMESQFSD
jgi:glycosyltransferase involved in cell wall biosynthesis